jgi:hypothetical protein
MNLVLQCRTNKSKTDWHQNKVRSQKSVQAQLWLPEAVIAGCEPERDSVAEKLSVQKTYHNTDPMHKSD